MFDKPLRKLSDIYGTEDRTKLQFTTNAQIRHFISEAVKAFEYYYPNRKHEIHTYFSIWKQIFDKLDYNTLDRLPINPFQRSMNYSFPPLTLYSIFNVDSILEDSELLRKTTLKEANLKNLKSPLCNKNNLRPVDWNKPILICDALTESIIIDGNHRYQNAKSQNLDIPVLIISYQDLSKQHFINEFNYAVFICMEEVNQCALSFDDATLLYSYLRMGEKFNL